MIGDIAESGFAAGIGPGVYGILVARRRSTAFLGSGIALFVGAGSLAVGVAIGSAAMATVAGSIDLSPAGLGVVYAQLSAQMAHTAAVLAVVGAVVAALAWTRGGSRAARSLRGGVGSINSGLRRGLAHRGADTGAFGAWLYRRRTLVHVVIAALGIAWLLALRTLSIGDVVLVLVVALLVWWVTELLQRRPGEQADETTDAAAHTAASVDVAS